MSSFIAIPPKPDVEFAYRFHAIYGDNDTSGAAVPQVLPPRREPASTSHSQPILLVFINGLALPMAGWSQTLEMLNSQSQSKHGCDLSRTAQGEHDAPEASPPQVSALLYDRYGQGESKLRNPEHVYEKHDLVDAAQDLPQLLDAIVDKHYDHPGQASPRLVLVAHSIGVPLARIFTSAHSDKHAVSAILMLDSNMTHTDFVSIYPDPDAPGFDPSTLPADTTVADLRLQRERTRAVFHPSAPNGEHLDRESLLTLLPAASAPRLFSAGGERSAPLVTVVGHDPDEFAEQGFQLQGTPKGLNLRYMSPFWDVYNRGLLHLTTPERVRGVVIAKRSGHFVQRDRPDLVVDEIWRLVGKLEEMEETGDEVTGGRFC